MSELWQARALWILDYPWQAFSRIVFDDRPMPKWPRLKTWFHEDRCDCHSPGCSERPVLMETLGWRHHGLREIKVFWNHDEMFMPIGWPHSLWKNPNFTHKVWRDVRLEVLALGQMLGMGAWLWCRTHGEARRPEVKKHLSEFRQMPPPRGLFNW